MTNILTYPRSLFRVLSLVNRVRVANGMKPLVKLKKGTPRQAHSCAIAASLNGIASVYGDNMDINVFCVSEKGLLKTCKAVGLSADETDQALANYRSGAVNIRLPKYVEEFVNRFDADRLPQLVVA